MKGEIKLPKIAVQIAHVHLRDLPCRTYSMLEVNQPSRGSGCERATRQEIQVSVDGQ